MSRGGDTRESRESKQRPVPQVLFSLSLPSTAFILGVQSIPLHPEFPWLTGHMGCCWSVSAGTVTSAASFPPSWITPRVRIVGVADDKDIDPYLEPLNRSWADRLGVPYHQSIEAAVRRSEVDIVSIGHEIERRAEIAMMAADAGKHLWIDKFIGADMDECNAVVDAVDGSGVLTILPSYIYNDLINQCRRMISTGFLGELTAMHVDILFAKGIPRPISKARGKTDFLPPGRWKFPDIKREILTVGAYAVALVQQCLEPIAEVYGQGRSLFLSGARRPWRGRLRDADARRSVGPGGLHIGRPQRYRVSREAGGPNQAYLFGTKGTGRIDGKRPGVDTHLRNRIVRGDLQRRRRRSHAVAQRSAPRSWPPPAPTSRPKR